MSYFKRIYEDQKLFVKMLVDAYKGLLKNELSFKYFNMFKHVFKVLPLLRLLFCIYALTILPILLLPALAFSTVVSAGEHLNLPKEVKIPDFGAMISKIVLHKEEK